MSEMIKVVGIGDSGIKTINRMMNEGFTRFDFIAVNTLQQSLDMCKAKTKLLIGETVLKGLGAGGNPDFGRRAAESSMDAAAEWLQSAAKIFIVTGLGGGTGTGASPVIAQIARQIGAETSAIVTTPFSFEGEPRQQIATLGVESLRYKVDHLTVIPGNQLLNLTRKNPDIKQVFELMNGAVAWQVANLLLN